MADNNHNLMEEYKLCQAKASGLSDNIWKTAAFFSVGSLAGIFSLAKDTPPPGSLHVWLLPIATFFAIGVLFTWLRFARRWWSIEHTLFLRMRHIECELGLKSTLYIKYLTDTLSIKSCGENSSSLIQLPTEIKNELDELGTAEGYEYRGLQPMMEFVIKANIAAWIAFLLLYLVPYITVVFGVTETGGEPTIRLVVVFYFCLVILGYGFSQWDKP